MRRAERLFRLVNEMRTRSVIRACDLAEHFEVSVSTIYRDMAHLQASGLPIDGEAGVGYMLRPGYDLPNMTFTHDQVDALALGLSLVEEKGDPDLAAAAREARAKIQAGMPRPEERKLADAPYFSLVGKTGAMRYLALLRMAVRQRHIAQFDYRDGNGNRTGRCVRPLVIWNLPDGWMFSAWCELRRDFRTFRLDRIENFALTGERFVEDEATGLCSFMASERCEAREH